MADLTKNINVGVDASGVKTGLQDATKSIKDFGKTVQNESSKSKSDVDGLGKSVSGLGPASEKSTKTSERAFSSWSAQVKKAAVEIQAAGDKVKEFELKAQLKGFSADAYKPQIDSLRQVIAEQEKLRASNINVGMSAAQMANSLRMVPAQLTDIVVSLQSGQQPMTVLLQQGGQLKDMFGGVGAAAKALGGYVLSLVNPFSLVAAGVAGLAAAYNQGSKENDAFVKSIALTGNASGVTTSQLREYARQMDAVSGTQSKAAASLAEFVSAGIEGGEQLKRLAQTAIDWEKATGQAVGETAKQFADLQKDPLKAVLKLNEGTNFLTSSVYEQIKALNDQGRSAEASRVAMDALDGTMRERSKTIQDSLGYLEKGWNAIKGAAKGAWDAMLNVGRPASIDDKLGTVRKELNSLLDQQSWGETGGGAATGRVTAETKKRVQDRIDALRAEEWQLEANAAAESMNAVAKEESAKATAAAVAFGESYDKYMSKSLQLKRELAAEEQKYQERLKDASLSASDRNRIEKEYQVIVAGVKDKYKESGKGPKSTQAFENEIAGIRARIDAEKELIARIQERGAQAQSVSEGDKLVAKLQQEVAATTDKRTKAAKELALAEAQKFAEIQNARLELEKQAKAQDEAEKSYRKYIDGINKSADAISDMADKQEAANASFGKSKVAIAEMAMEQAKLAALNAKDMGPWTPEQIAALEKLAREHERYVESLKQAAFIEASRKNEEQLKVSRAEFELQKYSMSLLGEEEVKRNKLIAIRKSELALEIEIAKIKKQSYSNDPVLDEQRKADLIAQVRLTSEENLQGELARIQSQYVNEYVSKYGDIFRQGFADFVNNGTDGLKAFGKSLKTTILTSAADALYKAFAQKFVMNVVANISGGGWIDSLLGLVGLAGGGSGGGGSASNLISAGKTGYDLYTGNGWAGQAWNTASGWLGYGNASTLSAHTVNTANAVGMAGGDSIGYLATAPEAAGAGGASGAAAVGWAAAAVIAAAYLGGMFKEEKMVGQGLTGDLGGDMFGYQLMRESGGLFDGPDYRYVVAEKLIADTKAEIEALKADTSYETDPRYKGNGAEYRDKKIQDLYRKLEYYERDYADAIEGSKGPIKLIQDAYVGMRENTAAKADTLGLNGDAIRAMKVALGVDEIHPDTGGKGLQLTGLSQQEAAAKIQEALAQANEELARSVLGTWEEQTREVTRVIWDQVELPSEGDTAQFGRVGREVTETITEQVWVMSEFVREGETAVQALDRMSGSLVGVNNVFELLGATLIDASLAGGDWASTLVEAIGGMDALTQAASSYFDLFYSNEEKRDRVVSVANKGMADKGFDLQVGDVDAKGKYRALMDKAIADKDEELIAWLLQFADDFSNGVDAVNAAIQEKAEELTRIREETVSTLGLSMDGLVDGFITEINEGRGATAGAWLADQIAYGFEEAVYQQGVTAILGAMIDGMITPMVTAAMTGASIADAVSGAAIDNMIANANAALQALNALLSSVEFIEGMEQIKVTIQGLGNSIGASIPPMRNYSSSVSGMSSSYDRASSAADDAARAAQKLADEWSKLIDSMSNEMDRLRGELLGGSQDQGMAYYESMFAIKTAQARAGDQDAAAELPSIIKALEELARGNATSQADVLLKQAEWLASLTDTRNYLAGKYGVDISDRLGAEVAATTTGRVIQASGNTAVLNALQSSSDNPVLVAEIRALRQENANLRADVRSLTEAIAPSIQQQNKLLRKWDYEGTPPVREGV